MTLMRWNQMLLSLILAAVGLAGCIAPAASNGPSDAGAGRTDAPPAAASSDTPTPIGPVVTQSGTPTPAGPTAAPSDTPTASPTLIPIGPSSTADPDLPCEIVATRTPPAGAATTVPSSIWQPPDNIIDPHIELCFSAPWVRVGEQIMIYAEVVDIGLPIYTFRADLSPESVWRLEVRVNPRAGWNEEPVVIISDNSAIVGFVRADLRDDHVIFVLEGRAGGSVNGSIYASGEVHYGYPGPAMWSGGSSDPFTITVAP